MKALKILALGVLAVCMLMALCACGNTNAPETTPSDATESQEVQDSAAPETQDSAAPETQDAAVGEFTTVEEGKLIMATNAYFPPYEF